MRGDYDVTYADGRKTVLLKADLANGWGRLEKTYGFLGQLWIHYPGDFKVRTMLTLLAQPATFDQSAAEFPDITLRGGTELTNYEIADRKLFVKVARCADQPWRLMMGKRPGIFFEELGLNSSAQKEHVYPPDLSIAWSWFDLRVWLVFHPPNRAPIPDVRVWCQKLFVPGGQFESNRRHH